MLQNNTVILDSVNDTDGYPLTNIDYAFFFASLIIFVPTVVGNSLILTALYRFRELRSPMGLLIGNLALSDFLVGLVLIPLEILSVILNLSAHKYYCLFNIAISMVLVGSSVLNMLAISIERYLSVAHPLSHRSAKTKKITKAYVLIMWILVIIIGSLPLMGFNKLSDNSRCIYTKVLWMEYTIVIASLWASCIISNAIFFLLVIKVAVSKLRKVRNSDTNHKRISRNLAKTYIIIIVSATFVVFWGPFCVLTFMGLFHWKKSYSIAARWAYFAGFLNSGINWMIYGFKNPKVRKAMKAVVLCKQTLSNPYITNSSESTD